MRLKLSEESFEYLADVDEDSVDTTTCWSTKKNRKKFKIRCLLLESDKLINDCCRVDCLKYNQDEFDSRPVTPVLSSQCKKFKMTNWKLLECRKKKFKKNLFPYDDDDGEEEEGKRR
mgnify:FL=1